MFIDHTFAILQQNQHLWHQLAMFFWDELLSWSWSSRIRLLGMPPAPIFGEGGMNPIEFKQKVTTNVEHAIGRITGIAPQYFSEEVSPCLRFHYVREFPGKKKRMKRGNGMENGDFSLSLFGCDELW